MSASIEILQERPGLPEIAITHRQARVRLSLQGAHITEYADDGENLLWVSESAIYREGAAIRGGIPVCWPWFGASPDIAGGPQHGFARTSPFQLIAQEANEEHASVTLALEAAQTVPGWPESVRLEFEIRLSDRLWMQLQTTNQADSEVLVGAGLHSYFRVSDSGAITVPALTGLDYLDKPSGFARRSQAAPLKITGEVDRVYLRPPRVVELVDSRRAGSLSIEAWGHTDLVVWNPGASVAKSLADFDDDGYREMVCIEPALALDNRRRLVPGESFCIGQTIQWLR